MTSHQQGQNISKLPRSFKIPFTVSPELRRQFLHVQTTGIIHTKPDYYIRRDTMDGMLLLCVLRGVGRLVYEGRSHGLERGSLFLIDCREYHEIYSDENSPMIFCFLHFQGPQAREYTRLICQRGSPVISGENCIMMHMRKIITTLKRQDSAALIRCNGSIHEILTELMLISHIGPGYYSHPPEYIERAIMFVEEHYFETLTLDDLAREAAVSKFRFTRLFRQHMGQSAYDYLLGFRMNKAKEMLIDSDQPIARICDECGFNNLPHFSRSFRKRENMSPKSYRSLHRDEKAIYIK